MYSNQVKNSVESEVKLGPSSHQNSGWFQVQSGASTSLCFGTILQEAIRIETWKKKIRTTKNLHSLLALHSPIQVLSKSQIICS